jgi:hypothetical protein
MSKMAFTRLVSLPTDGLKQNSIPVEFEEGLLPARKSTCVHGIRGVDPHSFERWAMSHGRNDEPSVVFETDESTVKEVVNTRRRPLRWSHSRRCAGVLQGLPEGSDRLRAAIVGHFHKMMVTTETLALCLPHG